MTYRIGLTTNAPPPIDPNGLPMKIKRREVTGKINRWWAPALYKAVQTVAGHWRWELVRILGESSLSQQTAYLFAKQLSWRFGLCKVTREALGNKRIK